MASAPFNEAFIIIRLDETGRPVQIMPSYTNLSTWVSTCLFQCRVLMETSLVVRNGFKSIAAGYPPELCRWRENMSDDDVVQDYFNKISRRFVLVCIAVGMKNLSKHACHFRRRYGNDGRPFNPHDQAIILNGRRVHQILNTVLQQFQHNSSTPPDLIAYHLNEPKRSSGEAGRFLEKEIFGGLITILHNPAEDEDQAGMPHLATKDGVFQILPQSIHEFLSFKFTLPITPLGPRRTPGMTTIGDNQPSEYVVSDPLNKLELQQLLADYAASPPVWDEGFDSLMANSPDPKELTAEQKSLLGKVPFDPSLRLEEEPKPQVVAVR